MLLSQFTIEDFFNDLKENKSMALFVGTGLDSTDVYPRGYYEGKNIGELRITWQSLLKELIQYACISGVEEKALGNFSSDLKAAVLKQKLEGGYIPIIQEWLYKRCNKTILEDSYELYDRYRKGLCAINDVPFYPLFVIAESILLQQSIRAVVTQNYDNFLSETIKILLNHNQDNKYPYRAINPIEIYDGWKEEKFVDNVFFIYHVHGYIPPTSELKPKPESNHIVLSQEEFFELGEHVFSWQNATQLFFLTHHTCVLLGLSLNDLTSVRVLKHANLEKSSEKVYVLTAIASDADLKKQTALFMRAKYFETQHVYFLCDEQGYPNLYHSLRQTVLENVKNNVFSDNSQKL